MKSFRNLLGVNMLTHLASRLTHLASRLIHLASRLTHLASRLTHLASRLAPSGEDSSRLHSGGCGGQGSLRSNAWVCGLLWRHALAQASSLVCPQASSLVRPQASSLVCPQAWQCAWAPQGAIAHPALVAHASPAHPNRVPLHMRTHEKAGSWPKGLQRTLCTPDACTASLMPALHT